MLAIDRRVSISMLGIGIGLLAAYTTPRMVNVATLPHYTSHIAVTPFL